MSETLLRRARRFGLCVALLLTGIFPARAADFAELVAALNAESYSDKATAADALAASGDAKTVPVLQAMIEGRLYVREDDKLVVIADPSGDGFALKSAATLDDAGRAASDEISLLTVNNRLRGSLQDAIGRLALFNPDSAQRLKAAQGLFRSPSLESAPLLKDALTKETDGKVQAAMRQALAAIEMADADPERRMAAIAVFTGTLDPQVRSLLQNRLASEEDPTVKKALTDAIATIENKLVFFDLAANLFQGVSLGSVLLLAAIGLAVTFGLMGVINMAHGEMIMLGAYSAYVVQEVFRAYLPVSWIGWYLPVALPVAFLVAGGAGVVIERTVIRWLYGRPLETLLATWGLSLMLQQLVRSIFGAPNKEVANPSWMSGAIELAGGVTLTYNRIYIILFCLAVLGLLAAVIRYTHFGLSMRAAMQNRPMAAAMGIPTGWVDALTFGLGSGIAGIAGVALSQIGNVSPNLGQGYIVDSFMVVVFGGVGSLWGTLVAALSLGLVNKFLEPYAGAVLGKILVLVFIILFIQKRPRGLFALKGRAAES